MEKPNYLKVEIEGIPPELLEYNQWVVWRAKLDGKKWTKIPVDAKNCKAASSTNPKTWCDFNTAFERYQSSKGNFDGIGFVLSKDDNFCGFDFDHCKKGEAMTPGVVDYVTKLKSYAEYSPSGDGVRAFCIGELPPGGRKKGNVECYDTGRYLTVTGHRIPWAAQFIRNASDVIPEIHAEIFPPADDKTNEQPPGESQFSDDEIIQKIQASHQTAKFSNLFEMGEWAPDYASQSNADLALCSILAFWCDRDARQIDRIFRRSKLMRDKWDSKRGGETYGSITIKKAIKHTTETYKQSVRVAGDITQNEIRTALAEDEDGDASIYIRIFRDRALYDHAGKSWYKWQEHFWELDKLDEYIRNIDAVIHTYLREQSFLFRAYQEQVRKGDDTEKIQFFIDAISSRISKLHKRDRKIHVTELATKGRYTLGITGEEWDRHTWELGCSNGVVDLKTGDLRPGRPSDYIRTVAPVDYPGIDAKCPMWDKFIHSVFNGDRELISFVHRVLGYSLLGSAIEHILPILWGSGRNGKGTLLEVLGRVMGDLAHKAESELLLKQRISRQAGAPNSSTSGLRGRRLVWCSEVGEGRVFDVARVKELVGGDTLSAREPYAKRAVEFKPSHTLFLLTNSKPHADASDYAFWQRVHLIPFEMAFVDDPKAPNEKKADKDLIEILYKERAGILAWLVRGCLEWQRNGLNPPDKVKAATAVYQKEEDIIGQWLYECCEEGLFETRAKTLYANYKEWTEENGYYKQSNTAFGKYMREKFDSRLSAGTIYIGVRVVPPEPQEWGDL